MRAILIMKPIKFMRASEAGEPIEPVRTNELM